MSTKKKHSSLSSRRKRCKCLAICRKKKSTCRNKLSTKELNRLRDILSRLSNIIPSVILNQDARNIRVFKTQFIRLSDLLEKSKLCRKTKKQVAAAVEVLLTLLASLPVSPINIVIQLNQIITQLSVMTQILQNTVAQQNTIMVMISNIVNIIDDTMGTPGAPGAPGPQGPPGIPGTFSPVYANLYDNADQVLVNNQPVRFNQFNQPGAIIFGGITATATSLTVPVAGDYAVLWETLFLPNGAETHCAFGIFVNGTLRDATRSGLAAFTDQQIDNVGSVAIVSLAAGDVVELRALIPPTSTQTNIDLSARIQYPPFGGVADQPINSASLRIFKLGPT